MRNPQSLEELLYRKLIESPAFNRWVRRIHAKINRIPIENPNHPMHEHHMKEIPLHSFVPTRWHKFNAFRVVWWDEMKRSFGLR